MVKTLALILLSSLLSISLASAQKYATIQSEKAYSCKDCLLSKMGQHYTYTSTDISPKIFPVDAAERQVYFGGNMRLSLAVEDIKSNYQIRITYLSDSKNRTVKVLADQTTLKESVALPMAQPFQETYTIPPSVYQDGHFTFQLLALSGPNVAITALEVLSTGKKPLFYKDLLTETLQSYVYRPARLSPTTTVVAGVKSPILSLNGTWDLSSPNKSGKIQVPGELEMQGYPLAAQQEAIYTKKFEVPGDWKDQQVVLRFDGLSSNCRVLLNGMEIGQHEGGFVQFEFDATNAIKQGQNKIEVRVTSATISDVLGCVSQYAAHAVGGILRKVTLMALPKLNMGAVYPIVKFDQNYENASVDIAYEVYNDQDQSSNASIQFALLDPEGKAVALTGNHSTHLNLKSGKHSSDHLILSVNHPKKWDTEHPNLYTLVTRLLFGDQIKEETRQKLGFRQIEIRGNRVFVNNTPIKLHGANRHDITALTGRSVSSQINVNDAIAFRRANCNYIRTSHYPPAEEFLAACDSLGIFVEAEAAITWIGMGANPIWREWSYLDPQYLPFFMGANYENIRGNRNHPSIIMWSLANESLWSPIWQKVNTEVKKYDTSRPTVFHDQTYGNFNNQGSMADIRNIHYPGIYGPEQTDSFKDRPVLFGEYYHVQTYNRLEEVTDPYIRADWGRMLPELYDKMYTHPSCLGGAIWAGIDDVFHLPDSNIVGYGPWGSIMDAWRREKPEFIAVRKSYAPFLISNLKDAKPVNGELTLKIRNRYDFANLNEGLINYTINGLKKTIKVDVPPGGTGELKLNLPTEATAMLITYTDPRGFIAQEEQLIFHPEIPKPELKKIPLSLKTTSDQVLVHMGDQHYTFDKNTAALVDDQLLSGVGLMIVPVNSNDGGAPSIAGNNYQKNIKPLLYQPEGNWNAKRLGYTTTDTLVSVTIEGEYDYLEGSFTYGFHQNGLITIGYDFMVKKAVDVNPRQWGLAFALPADFQHLSYQTKGYWSVYPAYDIARPKGEVDANPVHLNTVEAPLKVPQGPWSADANDLGSRDFRSTKANLYRSGLGNKEGISLNVYGDGHQSSRSWIDGNTVRFLIAELNGGGGDGFFADHYITERLPFKLGTKLKGIVRFKIN